MNATAMLMPSVEHALILYLEIIYFKKRLTNLEKKRKKASFVS